MFTTKMIESRPFGSGGFYRVERAGQQAPAGGDKIVVEATILLPAEDDCSLRRDLRFGCRVRFPSKFSIDGLEASAGIWTATPDGRQWRAWSEYFHEVTWAQAFRAAQSWAETELERLDKAIELRAQALEQAELDLPAPEAAS